MVDWLKSYREVDRRGVLVRKTYSTRDIFDIEPHRFSIVESRDDMSVLSVLGTTVLVKTSLVESLRQMDLINDAASNESDTGITKVEFQKDTVEDCVKALNVAILEFEQDLFDYRYTKDSAVVLESARGTALIYNSKSECEDMAFMTEFRGDSMDINDYHPCGSEMYEQVLIGDEDNRMEFRRMLYAAFGSNMSERQVKYLMMPSSADDRRIEGRLSELVKEEKLKELVDKEGTVKESDVFTTLQPIDPSNKYGNYRLKLQGKYLDNTNGEVRGVCVEVHWEMEYIPLDILVVATGEDLVEGVDYRSVQDRESMWREVENAISNLEIVEVDNEDIYEMDDVKKLHYLIDQCNRWYGNGISKEVQNKVRRRLESLVNMDEVDEDMINLYLERLLMTHINYCMNLDKYVYTEVENEVMEDCIY